MNKFMLGLLVVFILGYGEYKLYQFAWKRGAIAAFTYVYEMMDQNQQKASRSL